MVDWTDYKAIGSAAITALLAGVGRWKLPAWWRRWQEIKAANELLAISELENERMLQALNNLADAGEHIQAIRESKMFSVNPSKTPSNGPTERRTDSAPSPTNPSDGWNGDERRGGSPGRRETDYQRGQR